MINILLGAPGGGKSYEAVVYHILPALQRGRKVITNVPINLAALENIEPGLSALVEIRTETLAVSPDTEQPDSDNQNQLMGLLRQARASKFVARPFANVEDYADTWRHTDGTGPLYVIDECHFCLPRTGTARAVEEWFSMHRHFNVDVLLITQSSGKISASIKDLIQVCYKVRKAVALGKSNGYVRKVLDGVNGGEVSTTIRDYKPQYFGLYRSHTHGSGIAEQAADDVSPLLVRFNRFKWGFFAFTAIVLVYAFWPAGETKKESKPVWLDKAAAQYESDKSRPTYRDEFGNEITPAAAKALPSASSAAVAPAADVSDLEPLKAQGVHITGRLGRPGGVPWYTFAVTSSGKYVFTVTLADLVKSGYEFEPLGECMGRLRFGDKVRMVLCDAPLPASGENSTPVVMDNAGNRSRV